MKDESSDFPKWAVNLLRKFCPEHLHEAIEGDLLQKFHRDVKTFGRKKQKGGCCGMQFGFLDLAFY